jgi:hypothetical protein
MFGDLDWCNIYHVCVGSRDNIFLCPPGTIFNDTKQGCMDRFDGTNCNGTRSYYKPGIKRQKRVDSPLSTTVQKRPQFNHPHFADIKQLSQKNNIQQVPYEEKKSNQPRQVIHF